MRARERVLVAFVVGGGAGAAVDALRAACGSTELGRIAPHVTLVAPFNVAADSFDRTCAALERVASRTPPISCRLAGAGTFPPDDRVLYLAVVEDEGSAGGVDDERPGNGTPALARLAAECADAAGVASTRSFVAHVTLASPVAAEVLAAARPLLERVVVEVAFERLTVFRHDGATRRWDVVDEVDLGSAARVAAGSIDLELAVASRASWADRSFLAPLAGAGAPVDDDGVVVRGRTRGERVGVLCAHRDGSRLIVDALGVATESRAQGVGRRLVRHLERVAAARGADEVVCYGNGVGYFATLGYGPGTARAARRLGP